jgi:hypothetical protein
MKPKPKSQDNQLRRPDMPVLVLLQSQQKGGSLLQKGCWTGSIGICIGIA